MFCLKDGYPTEYEDVLAQDADSGRWHVAHYFVGRSSEGEYRLFWELADNHSVDHRIQVMQYMIIPKDVNKDLWMQV